jgi:DNA-binding FrmR family transcriptional regulator
VAETTSRGYSASKGQLLKRLNRVEGQVRGIERMVEEDRYCIDVVTQISAARAALDNIALGLVDEHLRHCLAGKGDAPTPAEPAAQADELMSAVGRLMNR